MKPSLLLQLDKNDIVRLNTLIPIAMTETAQHGRLKVLFNSNYLAKKSLITYACLSNILKRIVISYTNVYVVTSEAALADHISSYLISSKYPTIHCKWISLLSPSNLVGLTQGDPSKRRFIIDNWNSVNKDKTIRDYRPKSEGFILHSSSYLSWFDNSIYKLVQHLSTIIDYLYSRLVIVIIDISRVARSNNIVDIPKNNCKSGSETYAHTIELSTDIFVNDSVQNQQVTEHTVIHFMSSPGESFSNTSSIMTDTDIIRSYIASDYNKKIRFILKLHPHFENSYSSSDLRYYKSMGIEIWDPRFETNDYGSLLGNKRTVVTTAYGSIYLERILQGLPVFCFNDKMHVIKTPTIPDRFFYCVEEYISWYHQKVDQMTDRLISSSTILDFYDPDKLFPTELIDAIYNKSHENSLPFYN